jgi:hypothetical protein
MVNLRFAEDLRLRTRARARLQRSQRLMQVAQDNNLASILIGHGRLHEPPRGSRR